MRPKCALDENFSENLLSIGRTNSYWREFCNITSDDDLREAVKMTENYLKTQPAVRSVANVVPIGGRSS